MAGTTEETTYFSYKITNDCLLHLKNKVTILPPSRYVLVLCDVDGLTCLFLELFF